MIGQSPDFTQWSAGHVCHAASSAGTVRVPPVIRRLMRVTMVTARMMTRRPTSVPDTVHISQAAVLR